MRDIDIRFMLLAIKKLKEEMKGRENMNTKIDWKTKLTSRKLWMAIIGFTTPLLLMFNVADSDITKITAVIMAGGTLIAYIIGEGLVDSERVKIDEN